MRHKFYIPIGMPNLPEAPTQAFEGDTYYDTTLHKLRTWDGSKWATGAGSVTAGAALSGGGSAAEDIVLNVNAGAGIKIVADQLTLDTALTTGMYVSKSGDTMTGALTLPNAEPLYQNNATRKLYVDTMYYDALDHGISAGNGLSGGGSIRGNPSIHVGGGTGITIGSDSISLNLSYADGRWAAKSHTHSYAASSHTHSRANVGLFSVIVGGWSVAGDSEESQTVAHGFPGSGKPHLILATVIEDSGQQSVVCSLDTWDDNNVTIKLRNFDSDGETVRVALLVLGNPF